MRAGPLGGGLAMRVVFAHVCKLYDIMYVCKSSMCVCSDMNGRFYCGLTNLEALFPTNLISERGGGGSHPPGYITWWLLCIPVETPLSALSE